MRTDLKKTHRSLFSGKRGEFVEIDVPDLPYLKIDGAGDPNTASEYTRAIGCLYPVAYTIRFACKAGLQQEFVVPPLEGLWWSDDPSSFVDRRKSEWRWTMMLMMPPFVTRAHVESAVRKIALKQGTLPQSLRLERLREGRALQALHVGSYDDEGPLLAKLHNEIMPAKGLRFAGPHHEIYLSDPRKTAPAKLKTLLRQPVN